MASQTRTLVSVPPVQLEAMQAPLGDHIMEEITPTYPSYEDTFCSVVLPSTGIVCQTWTASLRLAEAMYCPSGDHTTFVTELV